METPSPSQFEEYPSGSVACSNLLPIGPDSLGQDYLGADGAYYHIDLDGRFLCGGMYLGQVISRPRADNSTATVVFIPEAPDNELP